MKADRDKALRMLGMATRAGKTASGATACTKAIERGDAKLVLIAEDAADDTRRKIELTAQESDIPCRIAGTGEQIGRYTGKENRMMAVILEKGFAERILELLDDTDR
ncbi:MAG: ribosomal L7Ae/L30e/S12e/Gadd45 family protein [Clostridia bacterium]|nr:ribosomal L7Ae/L30e/S12e/Gadd45 family protein [Clostridia bacterium]